jgi:conjugative relaxase-like TrwC/TraI family protein
MVATMAQAASSAYYLESQRSYRHPTEYYTAAGEEPDGVWFNPGGLLGLDDARKIDSKAFHRLYNGFDPETGDKLTRNAGSDNRSPGLDITFSADKSVSALWAIADPDLRIRLEKAHNAAARSALQDIFVKECSYTRTRGGGADGNIEVIPAHMLGAMFQHGTSRANDPQLHTHCVIFNAVQTESDGKWRALHQKPLYLWIKAAGACYRSYLASNLVELGIDVERYGKDNAYVRIKSIPEELEKLWSKRNSEIVAAAAEMGFETGDNSNLAQMLRIKTRDPKRGDQDPEVRHARWRQECEQLYECAGLVLSAFEKAEDITPDRIREWAEKLDELPHVLTRLQAVFRTPELAEAIYNLHDPAFGTLRPEAVETAIQRVIRNPDLVALDREPRTAESIAGLSHTVPLSTRHTLEAEQETRDFARALSQNPGFALPADAIERKIEQLQKEGYPISDEQTAAIRYVTGRTGAVSIIEGAAGSGKTTTIRPIVDLYREHGYNFIATAIPWRTAVELANDCEIPPHSAERLLKLASNDKLHLDEKSIVIVEEAGMLPTRHTHRILKLAQEHGAKVILLGDTQQQQPIEAGPGLRLVHDVVGSHRVDTMRRQIADAEDILRDIYGLSPDDAIAQAPRLTPHQLHDVLRACDPYDPQSTVRSWQIAASEDFRNGNAREAIEAYHRRDRIHFRATAESTVTKLVDDWHDFTRNNPDKSCVVLARTHKEIELLSMQMRERILADQDDPKSAVVRVSRGEGKKREYYDLEIRTGDQLRVGASALEKQLYTGTLLTVEDISVHGAPTHHEPRVLITARDDRRRRLTFYHDEIRDFYGNIRLDHGFALTMTSAQGTTVDRAFVLADDAPARETIYPAATRHRERLDIYIARDGILNRIKSNLPDGGADPHHEITEQDVLDHLASRWSRHNPKEAATDYTSDELLQEMLARRRPAGSTHDRDGRPDTPSPRPQDDRPGPSARPAINDNSHTLFAWASKQLRQTALDLRYGHTAAMVAQGRREVLAAYDHLRERARTEDQPVALSAEFRNTLFRQAQVLKTAAPFLEQPEKFHDLLQRRGSIQPADLQEFAAQYDRARSAQHAARNHAAQTASESVELHEATTATEPQPDPLSEQLAKPLHEAAQQTRSLPSAGELSRQLAARAQDVCELHLPHGKREGDQWHAATVRGGSGQTIRVNLAGPNAGKWQDTKTGARGDLLDLIRQSCRHDTLGQAMREATNFLGRADSPRVLQAAAASPAERADADARRLQALYDAAPAIAPDSAAARFLDSHGLDIADAAHLRFQERAFYLQGDDLRQTPAILAPLTTADGSLKGIQRIFITQDGNELPRGERPTSHADAPEGTLTWFGDRSAQHLVLCESVPEAITLLGALDAREREKVAVAALPHGIDPADAPLPDRLRTLLLLQSPSPQAARALRTLQDRHADDPINIDRIHTSEQTLSSIHHMHGRDGVRPFLQPIADALDRAQIVEIRNELHRDWKAHTAAAKTASVRSFYLPGHDDLVQRVRALRNDPRAGALSSDDLTQFDKILYNHQRNTKASEHVRHYLRELKPCLTQLRRLHHFSRGTNTDLKDLPDYPDWAKTAERFLADGQTILNNRTEYGACLDHIPAAWKNIRAGLQDLAKGLHCDPDTVIHRHSAIQLPPLTRTPLGSANDIQASADYRNLRRQWHDHIDAAVSENTHPYQLDGHAALLHRMTELRDLPLPASTQEALGSVLEHHAHFRRAPDNIEAYFREVDDTFDTLRVIHENAQPEAGITAHRLATRMGWTETAFRLAEAGKAMLADQERYKIVLDENPVLIDRIRDSVYRLNTAFGEKQPSLEQQERHEALQQTETIQTETIHTKRSFKP